MKPSILRGSRASYVNKCHLADLPQQNSKTTNTLNQYKRGKGDRKKKKKKEKEKKERKKEN